VDYYRKGSGQPLRNQTLLTAREQEIVRHLICPYPSRRHHLPRAQSKLKALHYTP